MVALSKKLGQDNQRRPHFAYELGMRNLTLQKLPTGQDWGRRAGLSGRCLQDPTVVQSVRLGRLPHQCYLRGADGERKWEELFRSLESQ